MADVAEVTAEHAASATGVLAQAESKCLEPVTVAPRSRSVVVMAEPSAKWEVEGTLTMDVIHHSLSHLGHNSSGDVVFTCCDLSNRKLQEMAAISVFRYLQHLSIDDNEITSLEPLQNLDGLVYLSARKNLLTERVFEHLRSAAFTLESLHVDDNDVGSLAGLHMLPYLIDFTANGNHISQLQEVNFRGMNFLMRVHLSHNNLHHIEPGTFAAATGIRVLDLSHNHIETLHFASYLTSNLDTLLLGHNSILHLGTGLSACSALVTLDLSHNIMNALDELSAIRTLESLRTLLLQGNRCLDTFTVHAGHAVTAETIASMELAELTGSLSRSELVMADDWSPDEQQAESGAEMWGKYEATTAAPRTDRKLSASTTAGRHAVSTAEYASLAAAQTRGLVRHVTAATQALVVPWEVDCRTELELLPPSRQSFYWLLHQFPHLAVLNGITVMPEYVARAQYYFSGDTEQ